MTLVAIKIECNGNFCGNCAHKFKGRDCSGMRWMCNLFRTESEHGHTGTCLNSNDNSPIRCRKCQDSEVKE